MRSVGSVAARVARLERLPPPPGWRLPDPHLPLQRVLVVQSRAVGTSGGFTSTHLSPSVFVTLRFHSGWLRLAVMLTPRLSAPGHLAPVTACTASPPLASGPINVQFGPVGNPRVQPVRCTSSWFTEISIIQELTPESHIQT